MIYFSQKKYTYPVMNKSAILLPFVGILFLALAAIISCDNSISELDYYYPRKEFPGRGEAVINGKKLSGRFRFFIDKSKSYARQLSIFGVLPVSPSKGGGGEWTISFKDIPPETGVYGLIPLDLSTSVGNCYSANPGVKLIGARLGTSAGDAFGDYHMPYCDGDLLPRLKITKLDTIEGYIEAEFVMKCVNLSDSTDFVTVENGKLSSPIVR